MIDHEIKEIIKGTESDDFIDVLTGKKCWRREKYVDYKANRPDNKPEFYHEARLYAEQEYNAVVTDDGREADDYICNNLSKHDIIACSADKDFNIVKGWHFNPKWKVKYYVTEEDADLWFACQLILGDKVDDIQGLDGWGKVRCVQILSNGSPIQRSVTAYKYYYGVDWVDPFKKAFDLLDVGQTRDVDDYIGNAIE